MFDICTGIPFTRAMTGMPRCDGTTSAPACNDNESIHKAWEGQLSVLVDQYLMWRHGTGVTMQDDEGAHRVFHVDSVGVFGT
jgi:hypothetical protein